MMDIKKVFLQWFINLLIKKTSAWQAWLETLIVVILEMKIGEELHKLTIRKPNKKVSSSFIGYICGADLADMQLISKFNKQICFLLWLLIFLVNANVLFLWKIKKVSQILMIFKNL